MMHVKPDRLTIDPQKVVARIKRGHIAKIAVIRGAVEETARPFKNETIGDFAERQNWLSGHPIICVEVRNGDAVPVLRKDWDRKIRRRGSKFFFITKPMGGGGGGRGGSAQIGGLIAMVALIAIATLVAGPAGGALGSAIGLGTTGTAVLTKAIGLVLIAGGSYLISHFLGAKSGGKDLGGKDPYYSALSGNVARPREPIPEHFGKLKFNPDFAAKGWVEYENQQQRFYGLYTIGVGEYEIHEIGVADTPIWTAEDGLRAGFPKFQHEIAGPGEDITLFPSNVVTAAEVSGQTIPDPYGSPLPGGGIKTDPDGSSAFSIDWMGPFIINPAGTVTNQIALDFVYPSGCYYQLKGDWLATGAWYKIEYRLVDDQGVPTGDGSYTTLFDSYDLFLSTTQIRNTKKYSVSPGRVAVRVGLTRTAVTTNGSTVLNWASAKAYLGGEEAKPNVTTLAVSLLADAQLSGYSQQQLYVIATRKLPVFDGTDWETQATQSFVWAAIYAWTNANAGGQSLSKLDLSTFFAYSQSIPAKLQEFNYRFVSETTVTDMLKTMMAPALCTPVYTWDRLSLFRDEERTVPRMLITDGEIIRGSVQFRPFFQAEDEADGTIIEYLNAETWQLAEVASNDNVITLERPARISMPGITDTLQAGVVSRYMAASNIYRRIRMSLDVEAEGKILERGSLILVSTEMPLGYGETVIITDYNETTRELTFHKDVTWEAGENHYLTIRNRKGRVFGPVLVDRALADNAAIVDATDLAAVETAFSQTIEEAIERSEGEDGPTAGFSVAEPREFRGLLDTITVGGGNQFTLGLVLDAPEMYDIDTETVPTLPTPPPLITYGGPGEIFGLFLGMIQEGSVLTVSAAWAPDERSYKYEADISFDDSASWQPAYTGYAAAFRLAGIPDADVTIRVRGVAIDSQGREIVGPWAYEESVSPGISYNPIDIGYTIEVQDLDPVIREHFDLVDSEISERIELEAFARLTAERSYRTSVRSLVSGLRADTNQVAADLEAEAQNILLLQGQASDLADEIATQIGRIDTNVTSISTLESTVTANYNTLSAEITSFETAVTSDFDALASQFNTIVASSGDATTLFTNEANARAAADTALGNQITTLSSTVDDNTAAITAEAATRASEDAALVVLIDNATASFSDNSAAISAEAVARADADAALTQSLNTLTSTVADVEASVTDEAAARATADTALSVQISTVSASASRQRVFRDDEEPTAEGIGDLWYDTSDGNAPYFWDGTDWVDARDENIAANTAAVSNEAIARASADDAIALSVTALTASLDTLDSELSAAITAEAQARADQDDAIATQITTVSAAASRRRVWRQSLQPTAGGVGDIWYDTSDQNKPYVWDGGDWLPTRDAAITANAAAITSEQTARATADTALAADISALSASVDTEVGTLQSQITSLSQTVVGVESSVALNQDVLEAGLGWEDTQGELSNWATAVINRDATGQARRLSNQNAAVIVQTQRAVVTNEEAIAVVQTDLLAAVDDYTALNTQEAQARTTADSALSATIAANVATLESDIADVSASVSAETAARVTADTAIAGDLTTLTSTVTGIQGDVSAVEASISSEAQTRADADSAISQTVTTLTAAYQSADTALQTAYEAADADLQDAIDAEAAARGTAITAVNASISSEAVTRANADSALSASIASNVASLEGDISDVVASVTAETSARTTADAAIAADLATLTSTVTGLDGDITAVEASITSEAATRATADTALAQSITDNVASLESDIADVSASVTTEAAARATADAAIAADVSTLNSTVSGLDGDITAVEASIVSEAATRATADSALSQSITDNVASLESDIADVTASVTAEATARANADTALSSSLSTLSSTVTGLEGDISTVSAAVTSEAQSRANADTALSTQITTVSAAATRARVYPQATAPTSPQDGDIWIETDNKNKQWVRESGSWVDRDQTDIAANVAAIASEAQARADADTAFATQLTALTATVNSNTSAITTEATARADADSALSTQVTTVAAQADAATAEGQFRVETVASPGTGVTAAFDLQVSADSGSSFQSAALRIEATPSGSRIAFLFDSGATKFIPFAVSSSEIILNGVTRVGSTMKSIATVGSENVMEADWVNGAISIFDGT